jgi:hypothetical protein
MLQELMESQSPRPVTNPRLQKCVTWIDVVLCGLLGLPGMLHYNSLMFWHGLVIGSLSVLADGFQIHELLFFDRIGALSTFVIWFAYGITLTNELSVLFVIYEIILVSNSIYWQRIAFSYFYYKKDYQKGIFYQRLWHIGAVMSMMNLFVANRYPHLLFF